MNTLNWQRLRVLKAVLDSESFSEAARRLGISQPTVSRHIKALEDDLGEELLQVTPEGVSATLAALRLVPHLEDMMRAADQISRRPPDASAPPMVRIACGPWIGCFLSRHIDSLIGDPVVRHIDISSSILFADIPRREADIAIRTQRPSSGRMRVKRLPSYSYGIYGAHTLVTGRADAFDDRRFTAFTWAMMAQELDHFATSKWLIAQGVKAPALRCSASVNLLDAAKSGRVLALIPCFVGDADDTLVRVSDPFVPDSGQIWMVLPDDVGRRPPVRQTADLLTSLFERHLNA